MTGTVYYNILSRYARFAYLVGLATGSAVGKSVDMKSGEHKSEEYLKVNPFGQVPAYSDDKVSIYESSAIARYLIATSKSSLLPFDDPVKFAEVDKVFEKINSTINSAVDAAVGKIFFGKLFGNPVSEETAKELIKVVDDKFAFVTQHFFQDSAYVTGTSLSLADLALYSSLQHLKLIGYDFKQYEKISKFYDAVSSVESVKPVDAELDQTLAYFAQ